jgi:hypothetical protein
METFERFAEATEKNGTLNSLKPTAVPYIYMAIRLDWHTKSCRRGSQGAFKRLSQSI